METDNGNGSKWTKGLLAGIGMTAGLAIGALSMGVFAGGLDAKIDGHVDNTLIHQTPAEKEAMVRNVIDREVAPALERMEARLKRIEEKLDNSNR